MFSKSSLSLVLISASFYSCATSKPPETESPQAEPPEATAASPVKADESQGTIRFSKTIQQACGLSDSEAHFKYDSAVLQTSDSETLDKVAICFISGPLAGEQMNLTGHADPRGDEEYNEALGGNRSENVKSHLVTQGMKDENISATSRGELDATGNDEAGWREDRRVDVKLASEH